MTKIGELIHTSSCIEYSVNNVFYHYKQVIIVFISVTLISGVNFAD